MESAPFNWHKVPDQKTELEAPPDPITERKRKLRAAVPFIALLLSLGVLYLSRADDGRPTRPTLPNEEVTEVLMPLVPLPRGETIDFSLFRRVPLRSRTMTPTQRQRAIRPEEIAGLETRLRAKKLLPPNRPVLWSDLDLMRAAGPAGTPGKAQVIYGEGSAP